MLDDTGAGRFLNGLVLGMALFGVSGAMRAETQAAGQGLSPTVVGPEVLNRLYPSVEIQDQGVTTTAIQDRMAALHAPGMSVAVIQGGRLAWAQGFGLTRQGGPAVTVNTLFQAGSVSKMLTAIAVLTLVEQGKLDLDRDVNQYLRSWKIPANEFTKARKVTLRMLLTHTGGINNGVRFFPRSVKRLPTITQILQGSGPAANSYKITVDHIPGTAWSYANGGYDIIQQLLEDVTGQPYDRFMAATVLEPLGMARSSYVEPLPEARLAEAATAHEISGAELADGPISIPEEAAGGLWTTPSDLCLVIQDLLGALNGESGHLLSPAMAKQMVTPGLGDWGLGCEVGTFKDGFHFGHGGDTRGFHTDLLAFNHGDGYVFMTNGDGGSTLEDDVRRTLAQAYGWPLFQPKTLPHAVNVDAGLLHRYAGRYMAQGFHLPMTFKVVEGQLVLDQPGYPGRRLVAADDHTFIGKESGSEVTFSLDANGTVVGASCTLSDGLQLGLDRVPPLKIRGAEPGAQIAPKRAFLDLSKDGPLGGVWCSDATMTAEVRSGQIQYRFDSGLKWGCSNFFPSNVSPLAQATAVDLRGYDSIQFQAKAPDKLVFLIHLSEAGSAAPDAKAFHGLHGSDGESYVFPALAGTGQWETYAVNLADGALRQEWGNQHGNGVLDLQAVDNLDFVIPGGQGKGELLVKDLEFRSAGQ